MTPAILTIPCRNCLELEDVHVGGKCLFAAHSYAPLVGEPLLAFVERVSRLFRISSAGWVRFRTNPYSDTTWQVYTQRGLSPGTPLRAHLLGRPYE